MIRRAPREIAYCAISAAHGLAGLFLLVFLVLSMLGSMTVLGTVVAVFFVLSALSAARKMGGLQRWFLTRAAGVVIKSPAPFTPGTGVLGRIEERLKDRVAWRAVACLAARLPLAMLQGWATGFAVCGIADLLYPLYWHFVHPPAVDGHPAAVRVLSPAPLGNLAIATWPGAFAASLVGVGFIVVAILIARVTILGDTLLARALLGPTALSERVRELERTRSLAVDSAASALRRVERNLHDGAQVRLTALSLHLGMAREKTTAADPDLDSLRELLDEAHADVQGIQSDLRDLARGIHPPALDNGLPSALASLAAASGIPVTVSAEIPRRPSPAIETIAYFCAAELMANAGKHSFANSIGLCVSTAPSGQLLLAVTDDGVGGADPARGSGLAGLRQRVAVVDGSLRISSPPGGPTLVSIELPMEA